MSERLMKALRRRKDILDEFLVKQKDFPKEEFEAIENVLANLPMALEVPQGVVTSHDTEGEAIILEQPHVQNDTVLWAGQSFPRFPLLHEETRDTDANSSWSPCDESVKDTDSDIESWIDTDPESDTDVKKVNYTKIGNSSRGDIQEYDPFDSRHTAKENYDRQPAKPSPIGEDSRPVNVILPITLGGHDIVSTPDTGSERNVISLDVAVSLRLELNGISTGEAQFCLANGRIIESCGTVSTKYSFPGDDSQPPLPITLKVIQSLIAKVIIGRRFLEATETLTKHATQRLSIRPRPFATMPMILHLDPPRRMLQCYLNDILVSANADTGAEMNLVSASFASKVGLRLQNPPPPGRGSVMLADGSTADISGFFLARFNPLEKPLPGTLRPRAHMKTFYVLDGLTSDVLLGRDLLFEIQAFTQQQKSFGSVIASFSNFGSDLHIIEWLKSKGTKPDFTRKLAVADQAEAMRRRQTETAISKLPEDQRTAAQRLETIAQLDYDYRKELWIADHKEQKRQEAAELTAKSLLARRDREAAKITENGLRERYNRERGIMNARQRLERARLMAGQ